MQDTVNQFTRTLILEELRSKRCQQYAGSEILSRLIHKGLIDDQSAPVEQVRQWVKQEMERMAGEIEKGTK